MVLSRWRQRESRSQGTLRLNLQETPIFQAKMLIWSEFSAGEAVPPASGVKTKPGRELFPLATRFRISSGVVLLLLLPWPKLMVSSGFELPSPFRPLRFKVTSGAELPSLLSERFRTISGAEPPPPPRLRIISGVEVAAASVDELPAVELEDVEAGAGLEAVALVVPELGAAVPAVEFRLTIISATTSLGCPPCCNC